MEHVYSPRVIILAPGSALARLCSTRYKTILMHEMTHLDLFTFRINKDLKKLAKKKLGKRAATMCREALVRGIEEADSRNVVTRGLERIKKSLSK